jgi:predicted ATPase
VIALCGAERVGKSTLAQAFARAHHLIYIPSRAGEVFRAMNLPVGPLPPEQRLVVQERILDAHVADIEAVKGDGAWIADRSTLDMAAYALFDLANSGVDPALVEGYVNRCFRVANFYYSMIVLVQPGIPYVEAEGKPKACLVRQALMNSIITGLLHDARALCSRWMLRSQVLDLDDRCETLMRLVTRFFQQTQNSMQEGAALH